VTKIHNELLEDFRFQDLWEWREQLTEENQLLSVIQIAPILSKNH